MREGFVGAGQGSAMKMIAEYLEHAIEFERLAASETNPALQEISGQAGNRLPQTRR